MLIKLADRLHNMRTLEHMPPEKQQRIARETLEIYAPLAHRLGIWQMKWELEDLAFGTSTRRSTRQIVEHARRPRRARERSIIKRIGDPAPGAGARRASRPRSPAAPSTSTRSTARWSARASVRPDLRPAGRPRDRRRRRRSATRPSASSMRLLARRSRASSTTTSPCPRRTCTSRCTPRSSVPAASRSRSRSAPTRCTRSPSTASPRTGATRKAGRRDAAFDEPSCLAAQPDRLAARPGRCRREFVEGLKIDVLEDQVFVFTPKGTIIDLPVGSTPVDFAYRIHTEVGHSCVGAKVNNRLVPLDYQLKTATSSRSLRPRPRGPSGRLARVLRHPPRAREDPGMVRASNATRTSPRARSCSIVKVCAGLARRDACIVDPRSS